MGEIKSAAVIGAGTMGSGIARHLANAGVPVLLLDIVPDGAEISRSRTSGNGRGAGPSHCRALIPLVVSKKSELSP